MLINGDFTILGFKLERGESKAQKETTEKGKKEEKRLENLYSKVEIKRGQRRDRTEKGIKEFVVLTAVVMKSNIFWDIMPCSPLKVNRRFGETCSSKHRLNFNGLHGVISQKIVLL
jgi:hypothetical protein